MAFPLSNRRARGLQRKTNTLAERVCGPLRGGEQSG